MYFGENHYHFFPHSVSLLLQGCEQFIIFNNVLGPVESISFAVFWTEKLVRTREYVAVSGTGNVGVTGHAWELSMLFESRPETWKRARRSAFLLLLSLFLWKHPNIQNSLGEMMLQYDMGCLGFPFRARLLGRSAWPWPRCLWREALVTSGLLLSPRPWFRIPCRFFTVLTGGVLLRREVIHW